MDWIVLGCVFAIVLGVIGVIVSRKDTEPPAGPGGGSHPPPPPPVTVTEDPDASSLFPLHVYYGSQTGTAEGFSKQIANDAKRQGFRATVVDMENLEGAALAAAIAEAPEGKPHVAIFVLATYGEGDPTDNAVTFTRWLKVTILALVAAAFPLGPCFARAFVFIVATISCLLPRVRAAASPRLPETIVTRVLCDCCAGRRPARLHLRRPAVLRVRAGQPSV